VRFDGGIDTVVHLVCNGKSSEQHLHNPGVTTMPAGGGVILQADVSASDTGPGTCTLYGTVHYSTA
jgi:urease alpha subunit